VSAVRTVALRLGRNQDEDSADGWSRGLIASAPPRRYRGPQACPYAGL